MRTPLLAVSLGLVLFGGDTLAQRAAVPSAAPLRSTPGLNAAAQKLESAYGRALEGTRGRATKGEWARYVGAADSEYQEATTHMPRGMAITRALPAQHAAKARKDSANHALNEAMGRAPGKGSARPSRADAQRWVQAQDEQIAAMNASLATRAADIRKLNAKGDRDAISAAIHRVGHERAQAQAKRTIDGAPVGRSEADAQKARDHYIKVMNRLAQRGGKR